jgi:hypothetical protein
LERGDGEKVPGKDYRPGTAAQRTWSVFGRGWNLVRNALAVGVILLGSWHPEAWPDHPRAGLPPTRAACAAGAGTSRHKPEQRKISQTTNVAHRLDSS